MRKANAYACSCAKPIIIMVYDQIYFNQERIRLRARNLTARFNPLPFNLGVLNRI